MNLDQLKNQLPDYAKDIRLNLSSVLSEEGAPGLNLKQIMLISLACAYATKQESVIDAFFSATKAQLNADEINAAKSAATIMAMNNIYYRFVHLVSDKSYATMPAKLRMSVIGNPGVAKVDFELASLAISAINGCGMCIDAHTHELTSADVSKEAIQSSIRIAAVMNAAATGVGIA